MNQRTCGYIMPNILILGAGGIGLPIASALKHEEHNLILSDYSEDAIGQAKEYFFNRKFDTECSLEFHTGLADLYLENNPPPSMVVSALPYHMNKDIAFKCVDAGIPYVDLGGHVDTTNDIRKHAEEHAVEPVASDQGLAPGLVNIVAEQAFEAVKGNKYRSAKIKMAVGGLPENRGLNPLDYIVTWSVDGLINEYEGEAEILEGAERKKVPTLTGLETMTVDGDELEAFYTSGGSAHTIQSMWNKGSSYPIPDVTYKTLRYPGHMKIVKWLMEQVEWRRLDMMDLFQYGCPANEEKDIVKFYVNATNGNLSYTKEHTFYASQDFSAMQRSTAYSAAAAIQTLLRGVNSAPNRAWMKCAVDYSYFNQSFFHERFRDALNRDRPEKEKEWVV